MLEYTVSLNWRVCVNDKHFEANNPGRRSVYRLKTTVIDMSDYCVMLYCKILSVGNLRSYSVAQGCGRVEPRPGACQAQALKVTWVKRDLLARGRCWQDVEGDL